MDKRAYDTDLTELEWTILSPLFPAPRPTGRPRKWSFRDIPDGIFYIIRGGNAWRLMPHDLPPWSTVYYSHRVWRLWGLWERVHTVLREHVRMNAGRAATPSAAIKAANLHGRPRLEAHGGTMEARRSADESGTFWSTPLVW